MDSCETTGQTRGEVRRDDTAYAGPRVVEEMENTWLEALHQPADGTSGQVSESGREVITNRV